MSPRKICGQGQHAAQHDRRAGDKLDTNLAPALRAHAAAEQFVQCEHDHMPAPRAAAADVRHARDAQYEHRAAQREDLQINIAHGRHRSAIRRGRARHAPRRTQAISRRAARPARARFAGTFSSVRFRRHAAAAAMSKRRNPDNLWPSAATFPSRSGELKGKLAAEAAPTGAARGGPPRRQPVRRRAGLANQPHLPRAAAAGALHLAHQPFAQCVGLAEIGRAGEFGDGALARQDGSDAVDEQTGPCAGAAAPASGSEANRVSSKEGAFMAWFLIRGGRISGAASVRPGTVAVLRPPFGIGRCVRRGLPPTWLRRGR